MVNKYQIILKWVPGKVLLEKLLLESFLGDKNQIYNKINKTYNYKVNNLIYLII